MNAETRRTRSTSRRKISLLLAHLFDPGLKSNTTIKDNFRRKRLLAGGI